MKKLLLLLVVAVSFMACEEKEKNTSPLAGQWGQTVNANSSICYQFLFSEDFKLTVIELDVTKKEKKEIVNISYVLSTHNAHYVIITDDAEWIYTVTEGNKLTIHGFNSISYLNLQKNYDPQAEYDKLKKE